MEGPAPEPQQEPSPPPSSPPPGAGGEGAPTYGAPAAESAPPPRDPSQPPEVVPGYGPGAAPRSAGELRGEHFRRLMGKPLTISLVSTATIAALTVVGATAGFAIGAAAGAGAALLSVLIVLAVAGSKAEADFFEAYASARSLVRTEKGDLPPSTPLLRKGDRRSAKQIMQGRLPGDLEGALALYTYEEEHTDSDGDTQTSYYHFTTVTAQVPEVAHLMRQCLCEKRSGFRFLDGLEDKVRGKVKRVTLESARLDERYEIFVANEQDDNWVRQLFSPSFIVWLAENPPKDFAWELVDGFICVSVDGHKKKAVELDRFCEAAAAVARRLREEAAEQVA